jgi:hypothetical protein
VLAAGKTARLRYETMLPRARTVFRLQVQFHREASLLGTEQRAFWFTALPPAQPVPAALVYPAGAAQEVPLPLRPLRSLLLAAGALLSLLLAAGALGVLARKQKISQNNL